VTGADRAARIFTAMARRFGDRSNDRTRRTGAPSLLMETGGSPGVIACTLDRRRLSETDLVRTRRNAERCRVSITADDDQGRGES